MKSKVAVVLLSIVLVIIFGISASFFILNSPLSSVSPDTGQEKLFSIARGASVRAIADDLAAESLVRSADFVYYYARIKNMTFQAGTFSLSPAYSAIENLRILSEGKQVLIRITIPEGLTLGKTAVHLENAGVVTADEFIQAASNPELLANLDIAGKTAEGFLFPDTYFFPYNETADSVVIRMVETFFRSCPGSKMFPKIRRNCMRR
ncbi:endolytic transglycosylase MltG [Brucepastera parasyntrophica]|uniref:endolytic transglycosylase MltG n=1 Tax=Brucepastera parasyntrophica TaxID=2880008 RepID=UPI00210DE6A9|nr:endolytic transglycosylase MltG [Brucepastera parasyntrophica]